VGGPHRRGFGRRDDGGSHRGPACRYPDSHGLAAAYQVVGYRQISALVERQDKFLEEYDVCAVSTADCERLRLAALGETDPGKAFLMDRKTLRKAKLTNPTKAKTAADRKNAWDKEEERRRSLGFPSQNVRRDYEAEWPLYKPHYQHLKAGIKVETCWLCDQNNAGQDQRHLELMAKLERDQAEAKAKIDSADALFCIG
jgi:hypothetical protein